MVLPPRGKKQEWWRMCVSPGIRDAPGHQKSISVWCFLRACHLVKMLYLSPAPTRHCKYWERRVMNIIITVLYVRGCVRSYVALLKVTWMTIRRAESPMWTHLTQTHSLSSHFPVLVYLEGLIQENTISFLKTVLKLYWWEFDNELIHLDCNLKKPFYVDIILDVTEKMQK